MASETIEDAWLWDSDVGREIAAEADASVTREEVLAITAKINSSLAGRVCLEREER